MRLSGLASGFDTDTMVKQLMQIERMKVDRVEQNKQLLLWRQESFNKVNKDLANFILNTQKDMGLKKTSSTGSLFGNSYTNLDYVKKAASSDDKVATVSGTGKAANASFDLEVITEAKSATFTSAKMDDFNFKDVPYMQFKINGHEVTVGEPNGKDLTMDDVIKAINNTKVRTHDGVETTKVIKDGKFVEMLNGIELTEAQQKEVKETSLGVSAFYDTGTGRIFMESSKSDSVNANGEFQMSVTGPSPGGEGRGFAAAIRGAGVNQPDGATAVKGNQGKVTINNIEVDVKNGKVEFNGLTIEVKAVGKTRINVTTNTEGIMEKIEKLVADYNELVDKVSGLTGEKAYNTHKPLSQEERKALSEEDLKLWDEKAKSGLLNNDETLEKTLQKIRVDLYKTLEGGNGSFNHITQLGISTERYAKGSAGGKLQIDTEKLRKAIEEDAEGVMELLFKDGKLDKDGKEIFDGTGNTSSLSTKGVFTRVYDDLIDGMKAIIDKSGPGNDGDLYRGIKSNMLIDFVTKKGSISDLDKSVLDMNRQIDNLNILLAKKEDAHYAKFTAMEKQMYQMQNQSSWLQQQFQF